MDSDTSGTLRDEVQKLVESYRTSPEEPPFSGAALVVIALLLNNKPLSSREILRWTAKSFAYYNDMMLKYAEDLLWREKSQFHQDTPADALVSRLSAALQDAGLPLEHITQSSK